MSARLPRLRQPVRVVAEPPESVVLVGTAAAVMELRTRLNGHRDGLRPIRIAGEALVTASDPMAPDRLSREDAWGDAIDRALISLPAEAVTLRQAVQRRCDELGLANTWIPTLADQLAGRAGASAALPVAQIDPAHLLDRPARPADPAALSGLLRGARVLITGAGGSIGSELARVVAAHAPACVVLAERSENALFEIDRTLRPAAFVHGTDVVPELHDITSRDRTRRLVSRHQPDLVLHAAAHKHVPMMEGHPGDAVENNFFGTRNVVDAAVEAGVGRVVMISTDKAVNPSSVMGATKRLAELYTQAAGADPAHATSCSMVRFGNVLGSACSVLPIWRDQLRRGGPLTVTHPDMTRYFMTIPEAAGLVLQAAAFTTPGHRCGDVFLLDMGEPVRIMELAHRFLRLQGHRPGVDVDIQITGPRPGEKLHEELSYGSENVAATEHPAVRRWVAAPPEPRYAERLVQRFSGLRNDEAEPADVLAALRAAVPEMLRTAPVNSPVAA